MIFGFQKETEILKDPAPLLCWSFFHVSYSVSSRLYFLPVDLKHSFILVANMMRTGDTIKNERVSIVTTQYALVITDILSLLDM